MTIAPLKAPRHLWLVGVVDDVMNLVQGPQYLASTGMTPEQIAHDQQMPGWMLVVWAVGVFGAFGASVLLLLRRRLALPMCVLLLAAFAVSLLHTYVLSQAGALMGLQMAITSAVIALLLVLFSLYARTMARRGVLR